VFFVFRFCHEVHKEPQRPQSANSIAQGAYVIKATPYVIANNNRKTCYGKMKGIGRLTKGLLTTIFISRATMSLKSFAFVAFLCAFA